MWYAETQGAGFSFRLRTARRCDEDEDASSKDCNSQPLNRVNGGTRRKSSPENDNTSFQVHVEPLCSQGPCLHSTGAPKNIMICLESISVCGCAACWAKHILWHASCDLVPSSCQADVEHYPQKGAERHVSWLIQCLGTRILRIWRCPGAVTFRRTKHLHTPACCSAWYTCDGTCCSACL